MSRVLVIDDAAAIRDLMVAILERDGYEAVAVESPERALELLDGASVVVSDVVMPGLTGLELLDEVRVRRPRMPFVLMSGAGAYEYLGEAVARGADGFVLKPFAHAQLLRAVAAALQGTAAISPSPPTSTASAAAAAGRRPSASCARRPGGACRA